MPLFPLALILVIVPGTLTLGSWAWDKGGMEDGRLDRAITNVAERVSSKLGDATTEGTDENGMKRKSSFNRYNSRKIMEAVPVESSTHFQFCFDFFHSAFLFVYFLHS